MLISGERERERERERILHTAMLLYILRDRDVYADTRYWCVENTATCIYLLQLVWFSETHFARQLSRLSMIT